MAIKTTIKPNSSEEAQDACLTIEFTNGTLKQLNDLATFLKDDGFIMPDSEEERLQEVVTIGIAWLQSVKERRNEEKNLTK